MMDSREKVFITGASRGLGLHFAKEFADQGWEVYAGARNPEAEALATLEAARKLTRVALDVLDEQSVKKAAAQVAERTDQIDVLINNAGIFPGTGTEGLLDLRAEAFDEAFATNVTGVVRVTQAFLPLLRRAKAPRIINISSGAGSITEKDDFRYYPYAVSKAGLNMLTRAMAAEFQEITVVAMSPGWVRTDMGGPLAPLDPSEVAATLVQTVCSLGLEHSGRFFGRDLEPYAW